MAVAFERTRFSGAIRREQLHEPLVGVPAWFTG